MRHPTPPPGPFAVRAGAALLSVVALTEGCAPPPDADPTQVASPVPASPTAEAPAASPTPPPSPPPPAPWRRSEISSPGPVTFNELHYHPGADQALEWLELHNPLVLDVDLSGWALEGGVRYTFPEGARLPARGYLLVAADPGALAAQVGVRGALGPYDGALDNGGERIDLRSNGGRLIDALSWRDDSPWPVGADGSGFTLAKRAPGQASDHAEHWTVSPQRGGTPGRANGLDPSEPPVRAVLVAEDAEWRYAPLGEDAPSGWTSPGFDDSAWATGQASFYYGEPDGQSPARVTVTADNYYGVYLGEADGANLRPVGQDPDGDWTTAEGFDATLTPRDHLYVAAWEAPWDYGGPQMTIAEVEVSGEVVGTAADTFEWILGPAGGCPGTTPADPAPAAEALAPLIQAAELDGAWAAPAVEAPPSSDPWGWALGGAFDGGTRYVWADTFSDTSLTNLSNTYALFRSRAPIAARAGETPLPQNPTTTLFRVSFPFDADPSGARLALDCRVDDAMVVYLNGVEVLRHNLPPGPIDAQTLALTPVSAPAAVGGELPTAPLVRGTNLLAVEVHQASDPDPTLAFGCALSSYVQPALPSPTLLLNEIAPAGAEPSWVELVNVAATPQDPAELVIESSGGGAQGVGGGAVAPGGWVTISELGFPLAEGDVLYLRSADGRVLLDAVRVGARPRAREGAGGPWRTPTSTTPGGVNHIDRREDVVISEILYHHAPLTQEGVPEAEPPQEWIELFNQGAGAVDLSGWQLTDAVAWSFPEGTVLGAGAFLVVAQDAAALRESYPDLSIVGDYEGRLSNQGERILLLDARGNPADEVAYADGGRWPRAPDGGGSSLELRDVRADNLAAEAWAASEEGGRSEWVSYQIRGEALPSAVGPDGVWHEWIVGLLDEGEALIDDVRVVQDPATAPVEVIQNGDFSAGASHWRLLGTHRHSAVVPDPDDPANPVLHLVATGPTEHMHNHAETTLLLPIEAREYEISFRARWLSGSNQLHSRLYFNRMATTTALRQPSRVGTPGAPNSAREDNLGPTFSGLRPDMVLPPPGIPVTLRVDVSDPDGVRAATLWTSIAGAPFQSRPMEPAAGGAWAGAIEGQPAGTIVQLYVEAEDQRGAKASFPAAGPNSRALLTFADPEEGATGLHTLRILMTEADSDWLHEDVNLMSNDPVGATVVWDEREIYFDVGVRTKGSERGRPEVNRLGYGLSFHRDRPFRGSHQSVLIDRSQGVHYGQREVLHNLVMAGAGSPSAEYNDLIQLIAPRDEYTGPAELQLDRFSALVLDAQFDEGASGTRYEYELIYYPLTTHNGAPDGLKLPQPDAVIGTAITDLGPDKEAYRWNFLIRNNERADDFDPIIALGEVFSLPGPALLAAAPEVIDVEQWLRAFAFATLSGTVDQYGGDGSQHNAQLYLRPEDQKLLYFPHDLDFYGGETLPVVGNGDLARLIADPANHRSYYGHLQDIIGKTYNDTYLAPWCQQLSALLPGQDFDAYCQSVALRAEWVLFDAPDSVMAIYPPVSFAITTRGGANFTVASRQVTLAGTAWVDARQLWREGEPDPLPVRWTTGQSWEVDLPLDEGPNELNLFATDLDGAVVGTDSITVTSPAARR